MNFACPCCRNRTLSEEPPGTFEVCPVCFWEDDELQLKNVDYASGANNVSLRCARQNYIEFGACHEDFMDKVRLPTAEEIPDR
jgi:hypothetical protein